MAQRSARRDRVNQGFPPCFEHTLGDSDPIRELPYRPATTVASKAGQMAASDFAFRSPLNLLLRGRGRPQMETGHREKTENRPGVAPGPLCLNFANEMFRR